MAIDRDGPGYLYLHLAALLRERIRSGEMPPRSRVPPLAALAAEHGVAEMTARKALRVLKDEGLVEAWPGKGTYVSGG